MIKPSRHLCLSLPIQYGILLTLLFSVTCNTNTFAQTLESGDPILQKANALYYSGKGEQAESLYQTYLKLNPQSPAARVGLAKIAERRNQFPLAQQYLEPVLQLIPQDVIGVSELGHLYDTWPKGTSGENNALNAQAQDYLKRALQLDPNHPLALTYFAQWQLHQGNRAGAEKTLYRVIGQKPTFIPALQTLAQLYLKAPDVSRAKQTILQTLELDPQNPQNYLLLAQLFALKKQSEESVRYASKSQQLDFGTSPERDQLLAEQYAKLGDIPQAIAFYDRVLDTRPNDPQLLMSAGELYAKQGNTARSVELYQNAIQQDPTLITGLITKAQTLGRLEKAKEGLQVWRQVLAIKPNNLQALHGLASLNYLTAFYKQVDQASLTQDLNLLMANQPTAITPLLQLDLLKLLWAQQGQWTPPQEEQLKVISQSSDDLAAGEALFFLGEHRKAQERFDAVDGQTGRGYLEVADRLLLDQELLSAEVLYQRGSQIEPLNELSQGLQQVAAKKHLAEQKIEAGNASFSQSRYTVALSLYDQAHQIYREWEVPCLRLAEVYEKLHEFSKAFKAYQQAVVISPNLMESKGFAKKYHQLERKAKKG